VGLSFENVNPYLNKCMSKKNNRSLFSRLEIVFIILCYLVFMSFLVWLDDYSFKLLCKGEPSGTKLVLHGISVKCP
jgi:hypothetical protein